MSEETEIQMVDLLIEGTSEGNLRSVFPVTAVELIEENGEQAVLFTAAETPSKLTPVLPVKRKYIISLFSYNVTDPAAPAPRVGEVVSTEGADA